MHLASSTNSMNNQCMLRPASGIALTLLVLGACSDEDSTTPAPAIIDGGALDAEVGVGPDASNADAGRDGGEEDSGDAGRDADAGDGGDTGAVLTTLTEASSLMVEVVRVDNNGAAGADSLLGLRFPLALYPDDNPVGPVLIATSDVDDPSVLVPEDGVGFSPFACAGGVAETWRLRGDDGEALGQSLRFGDTDLSDGLTVPTTADAVADWIEDSGQTQIELGLRFELDTEAPSIGFQLEPRSQQGRNLLPFEALRPLSDEVVRVSAPVPRQVSLLVVDFAPIELTALALSGAVLDRNCADEDRFALPLTHAFLTRPTEWWQTNTVVELRSLGGFEDLAGNRSEADEEGLEVAVLPRPQAVSSIDFSGVAPVISWGAPADRAEFGCTDCLVLELEEGFYSGVLAELEVADLIEDVEVEYQIMAASCSNTSVLLRTIGAPLDTFDTVTTTSQITLSDRADLPAGFTCGTSVRTSLGRAGVIDPLSPVPLTVGFAVEFLGQGLAGRTAVIFRRIEPDLGEG